MYWKTLIKKHKKDSWNRFFVQNSYFNGSKQTSATNILGGSPVQTFTTNPNILKVSDTGRGSGEPILVVD